MSVVKGNGTPYSYTTNAPFDPSNFSDWYANNVTWTDARPQPTIIDIVDQLNAYEYWWENKVRTDVDNLQAAGSVTVNPVTRTLDTTFRPSTTQNTLAVYSCRIVSSSSLSGGQLGDVILEIADDSGFTSGVTEVSRIENGQTGTLVVGLNLIQTFVAPLVGVIPANKYARLRSLDTTGSPVQSYVSGQETVGI